MANVVVGVICISALAYGFSTFIWRFLIRLINLNVEGNHRAALVSKAMRLVITAGIIGINLYAFLKANLPK